MTYYVAFLLDVQSRRIQVIGCTPYPNEVFVIQLAIRFDSFAETNMQLFDYIETVHNQRRHSTLGQISPAAFE